MRALLDINVLISLLDDDHVHHARARDWLVGNSTTGWASCPLTQNGCVRIMAQPRYPNPLPTSAIIERLAESEPDRADYQRDLSVSYNKVGDLYRALGQGEPAREAYLKSLAIRERLAQAEPDRADYQRDLSVSYDRMGDLYSALGQGEPAREACQIGRAHV